MKDNIGFFAPPPPSGKTVATTGGTGLPFAVDQEHQEPGRRRRLHRLHHQRRRDGGAGQDRQPAGQPHRRAGPEDRRARPRSSPPSTRSRRRARCCRTWTTPPRRWATRSASRSRISLPRRWIRPSSPSDSRTTMRPSSPRTEAVLRRADAITRPAPGGAARRGGTRTRRRPAVPRPYGFVLPGVPGLRPRSLLYPLLRSVQLSLFEWDGLTVGTFVGLDNYRKWSPARRCGRRSCTRCVLIFFYAVLPVVIGLVLAAMLSRAKVRGLPFFRTVVFLPQVDRDGRRGRRVAADLRAARARSTRLLRAIGLDSLDARPGSATTPGRCPPSASSAPGSRIGPGHGAAARGHVAGSRSDAVRGRADRRRRRDAGVLRRHAAERPRRDHRRADADDHRRAQDVRPRST